MGLISFPANIEWHSIEEAWEKPMIRDLRVPIVGLELFTCWFWDYYSNITKPSVWFASKALSILVVRVQQPDFQALVTIMMPRVVSRKEGSTSKRQSQSVNFDGDLMSSADWSHKEVKGSREQVARRDGWRVIARPNSLCFFHKSYRRDRD